jgi:arsenate reductase-like glutaredoxin family protein
MLNTCRRDLGKEPLSAKELDVLIGDGSYLDFLNPQNEIYRDRKMKEQPPSRQEPLRLMAAHPSLIRRPFLVRAGRWP